MRKYFFCFALFLVGCFDNGNGGFSDTGASPPPVAHIPEVTSFVLSPDSAQHMDGDGNVVVSVEIGFKDTGLDIETLWVLMPDGTSVEFGESIATETGTFTEAVVMPTNQIGIFFVERLD